MFTTAVLVSNCFCRFQPAEWIGSGGVFKSGAIINCWNVAVEVVRFQGCKLEHADSADVSAREQEDLMQDVLCKFKVCTLCVYEVLRNSRSNKTPV